MDRRQFLRAGATGAVLASAASRAVAGEPTAHGETLYNGIRLPSPWPPHLKELPRDPIVPPYLKSPPAVIPIDLGRQLFVDDFLVEETTLTRTFHRPVAHKATPVLRPDT